MGRLQIIYIRFVFLPKINFKLEFFEWYKIYKRVTVKSKPLPALVPSHPLTVPMHNQYYSLCICPEVPCINEQSCICSSPLLTQMVTTCCFHLKVYLGDIFILVCIELPHSFFLLIEAKLTQNIILLSGVQQTIRYLCILPHYF